MELRCRHLPADVVSALPARLDHDSLEASPSGKGVERTKRVNGMVGEEAKEGEGRVVFVNVAEYKLVQSRLLVVVGDVDEDAGGAGDRRRGGGERRRGS